MPPPLDLPPEVLALVKRSNLLSTRDTKALVRKGLLSEDSAASLGVSIRKPPKKKKPKPKPPVHAVHPELLMQQFKPHELGPHGHVTPHNAYDKLVERCASYANQGTGTNKRKTTEEHLTPTQPPSLSPPMTMADVSLLSALRQWRATRARSVDKPAFVVFSNAVLVAIVSAKPSSHSELARISGVGPQKLRDYGDDVLRIIRVHSPSTGTNKRETTDALLTPSSKAARFHY